LGPRRGHRDKVSNLRISETPHWTDDFNVLSDRRSRALEISLLIDRQADEVAAPAIEAGLEGDKVTPAELSPE
jgi:hypothetical protein